MLAAATESGRDFLLSGARKSKFAGGVQKLRLESASAPKNRTMLSARRALVDPPGFGPARGTGPGVAPPTVRVARRAGGAGAPAARAAELTDHDLALALLSAAPAAPRIAWSRYSPLVRKYLRRFFGPRVDVEDLVQEVFLCLFRRLPTLRDPSSLPAFIIAITVRTARHQARRVRARRWLALSAAPDIAESRRSTADVAAEYALVRLYAVLSRIRACDRTCFVLRFIEGMQSDEIAKVVGVSIPTVRRRFTRAWGRVSYLASQDPFLAEYVRASASAAQDSLLLRASI